jgi:alanine racemase
MLPVVELHARIVQVLSLARGKRSPTILIWTAKRRTRLALVSIGYVDGYPRSEAAFAKMQAIVGGCRCPVAGRPSMDLRRSI